MSLEPFPSTTCSRSTPKRVASAVFSANPFPAGDRVPPATASAMACRTRGLGPRGFSLEASLTMSFSASPYSHASSSTGLPGTYGAMRRTYSGESMDRSPTLVAAASFTGAGCRRFTIDDSRHCGGIRSEELQEWRALAQLRERRGNRPFLLMALEVDEKQIFPKAGARRTGFEPAHADPVFRQRLQQRMYGTRTVVRRHHQRGLIATGWCGAVVAQDPETRCVIGLVFDMRCKYFETVDRRRGIAGDRRRAGLSGGHARRLGIARHRNACDRGQGPR